MSQYQKIAEGQFLQEFSFQFWKGQNVGKMSLIIQFSSRRASRRYPGTSHSWAFKMLHNGTWAVEMSQCWRYIKAQFQLEFSFLVLEKLEFWSNFSCPMGVFSSLCVAVTFINHMARNVGSRGHWDGAHTAIPVNGIHYFWSNLSFADLQIYIPLSITLKETAQLHFISTRYFIYDSPKPYVAFMYMKYLTLLPIADEQQKCAEDRLYLQKCE